MRKLLILAAITLLIGCSKTKQMYESKGEPPPEIAASIFPHKATWGTPEEHGKFVIDYNTKPCANACHGENLEGGSARGCKTCHSTYPHPPAEIWEGILGHGKQIKDNGIEPCSTKCHGAELAGGYDPYNQKSCGKCHPSYPNIHKAEGWTARGHGEFVRKAGNSDECGNMCHRLDVPTELKVKSCADCHPSYPLPHKDKDWRSGKHRDFLSNYGGIQASDCFTCHGDKNKPDKIACATSSCHHSGGAGKKEWDDGGEHGTIASSDITKCTKCHGADLKGTLSIEGCDKCHHKNWQETHKPWADISQHGAYGKEPATGCKLCHGGDLLGGLSGIACKDCHGGLYPHPDDWAAGNNHGATAKVKMDECIKCHTKEEGLCKTCHHDNVANWQALHAIESYAGTDRCKTCHGTELKGGDVAAGCDKCHGQGMSMHKEVPRQEVCCADDDPEDCWDCIRNYAYTDPIAHGEQAKQDIARCRVCHGADLKGGFSEKTCYNCHDSGNKYPHENIQLWKNIFAGIEKIPFPASRQVHASCSTACHGHDFAGGISGVKLVFPSGAGHCLECHQF